MGKEKDLTIAEKQNIIKFPSERIYTLGLSKVICRDHQMVKKTVENITKLRYRSKNFILCFEFSTLRTYFIDIN